MSISLYSKGSLTRDYHHWKAWTFYFPAILHLWGGSTPGPEIAIEKDYVKKWFFYRFTANKNFWNCQISTKTILKLL